MVDYAIDIRIQARLSGWNQAAEVDAFLLGLADYAKDKLGSHDLPSSIIELVSRVDRRFQARRRERRSDRRPTTCPSALPRSPSSPAGQPTRELESMKVGRASLTPEERELPRGEPLSLLWSDGILPVQ